MDCDAIIIDVSFTISAYELRNLIATNERSYNIVRCERVDRLNKRRMLRRPPVGEFSNRRVIIHFADEATPHVPPITDSHRTVTGSLQSLFAE